jgi:osmotically-inducible protein OsmY
VLATASQPAELVSEQSERLEGARMGDIEDVGAAIADELTFDPDVDASGITVRIVNGEVTLAGTVPSYSHYLAATAARGG